MNIISKIHDLIEDFRIELCNMVYMNATKAKLLKPNVISNEKAALMYKEEAVRRGYTNPDNYYRTFIKACYSKNIKF